MGDGECLVERCLQAEELDARRRGEVHDSGHAKVIGVPGDGFLCDCTSGERLPCAALVEGDIHVHGDIGFDQGGPDEIGAELAGTVRRFLHFQSRW